MNDSQDTEKRVEAGMTDDQLMKLVTRYTEACVNPASGLFEQPASDTDSKHAKVAQLWAQIGAEVQRLHAEGAKSERRAIAFGDSLHHNILAMRAAVVAWQREGAAAGMKWIANSLAGPGHLPSEPDIALGAQALFDMEMAEHEAFRIAHPAPEALRTSGDSHTAPLRNASADGYGKYAVLNLRKLAQLAHGGGDTPHQYSPEVQAALDTLDRLGVLDRGAAGDPDEFFVVKLKDQFAAGALRGYAEMAEAVDSELASYVFELATRAGVHSPFCKRPD